ncbi:hypothetical protein B0A55_04395 [Friedmanniomyces simplex]|uniref:Uncharacterized protein n=1 Tax=Friedmanniomyces simplex TaxID=329884 RepID=A0A4U0XIQ9_9PEZI|nr:hypothetical protein B0A55_04395 [Friedmanniomyces simplex]
MSVAAVESRKHGVKGQRIPGRPGRFDPSEPMHMTTRRRAKDGVVNGTPSVNGSNNDDHSPRGSLDETRPLSSYSLPSQASPETPQYTNTADMTTTPAQSFSDTNVLEPPPETAEGASLSPSANQSAPSPSRKRKRDSVSPPSTPNGQVNMITTQEAEVNEDAAQQQSEAEDAVELIDPSQLSDREESYDDADSESEEQLDEEIAAAPGSLDMTPAASAEGSPASSVSQTEELSIMKPLDGTVDELMPDAGDEALPELADIDDLEDGDDQARTDDDGRPVIRKFGGKRRRAAHHLEGVEMRMRRQLETKKAYRTIARELKAVLAEISQRTLDQVVASEGSYVEAAELQSIKAGLNAALEKRNALVRAQHKLNVHLLKQSLHMQERVRRNASQLVIENAQDAACDRLQHDFLTIARKAQLQENQHEYATEDEDDVVPRPKRAAYRFKRGDALDPVYESRSRLAVERERSMKDVQCRLLMRKMLQALPEDDEEVVQPPFAVMDSTTRDAATARSEEANSIGLLAAAANEAERIASIPKVRNEDAHGLQLLSDLCVRPSITALASIAPKPNTAPEPAVHQTPPRPPPQPIASPQMNSGISVAVSPAAHQFLRERERYEPTMTGVPDRRAKRVDERPPSFDFLRPTPTLPERHDAVERAAADQQRRAEPPPNKRLRSLSYNRPLVFDRPRSPNAADRLGMTHPRPSITEPRFISEAGAPESLRSRASSLSVKEEKPSEGSPAGEKPPELRFQQQQPWHQKKTNKAERGGESRRAKNKKKKEIEKVHHEPSSGSASNTKGPPHSTVAPLTAFQGGQGPESRPWHVPAPQQPPPLSRPPSLMPPPAFAQHYGLPRLHGSPPDHDPHAYEHQHQGHRNSFPPPTGPPPGYGPPPPGWNAPPPPSPLYAIPQPPAYRPYQPPPPPGAEQYQTRLPPPPPLFDHQQQKQQQQRPPMTPPLPLSTPLCYGPQYGGPALAPAPAMPDPRLQPPGFRPGPHNHPPAFAQQRGLEGQQQRRRTQSDVHLRASSWRSYEPGGRR